jgi:hypothetical protein
MRMKMVGLIGALLFLIGAVTVFAQVNGRATGIEGNSWHSDLYDMNDMHDAMMNSQQIADDMEQMRDSVMNIENGTVENETDEVPEDAEQNANTGLIEQMDDTHKEMIEKGNTSLEDAMDDMHNDMINSLDSEHEENDGAEIISPMMNRIAQGMRWNR